MRRSCRPPPVTWAWRISCTGSRCTPAARPPRPGRPSNGHAKTALPSSVSWISTTTEMTAADPVVKVTVASLGRDERTGLDVGDWVELIDDTWAPQGTPAPLLGVRAIDRADRIITLGGGLTTDLSLHPYLRRWDQAAGGPGSQDGIPIVESPARRRRGHLARPRRRRSGPLLAPAGPSTGAATTG